MRPTPDNITRLHQQEEAIRAESLEAISKDESLSDHLQALHDALDHLTVLMHFESKPGDSAHTLQLLAMRLFNCGAAGLQLGLSGYYQAAFQLLRDSLELVNLVDLFRIDCGAIERWKAADDKALKTEFGPARVRLLLEKHPDFAGQRRDRAYTTFSGYAAHPSYKGFQLIAPDNKPKLGPFFDQKLLLALLADLGKHISHASLGVGLLLETDDLRLLRAKAAYLDRLRGYHDKHLKLGTPKP
jgi:hypothetical protein